MALPKVVSHIRDRLMDSVLCEQIEIGASRAHPVSVWCGSALQEDLSGRQRDAMTTLALLDVTLYPYRFLVALWAAMRSGIIAERKKNNARIG